MPRGIRLYSSETDNKDKTFTTKHLKQTTTKTHDYSACRNTINANVILTADSLFL